MIVSKKIKILSRGRYPHKFGVVYGPTKFWYRERVENIKDLLMKHPDIEIVECINNEDTVKLNLQNVETDNRRTPVNMLKTESEKETRQQPPVVETAPEELEKEENTLETTEPEEEVMESEELEKEDTNNANQETRTYQGGNYQNNKKNKKNRYNNNNLAVNPSEP